MMWVYGVLAALAMSAAAYGMFMLGHHVGYESRMEEERERNGDGG